MADHIEKITDFGQFIVKKIGSKYIHADLVGSLKCYTARIVNNQVVQQAEVGQTVFLKVNDLTTVSSYGTKLLFEPVKLLTDKSEIDSCILEDRKRVATIYMNAAIENLEKGWYSGGAIEKALIFSASHPDLLPMNIDIRCRRLQNIIQACKDYQYKTTDAFIHLSDTALKLYQDEKELGQITLSPFEKDIELVRGHWLSSKQSQKFNALDKINQLKALIHKK